MSEIIENTLTAMVKKLPEDSAALVTSPFSIRYLSGQPISKGIILASKEIQTLFVSQKDFDRYKNRRLNVTLTVFTGSGQLLDILVKFGIKRVFIEADKMTVSEYEAFRDSMHYAKIDTSGTLDKLLMDMRICKSGSEIEAVAKAQRICDLAYDRLLGTIRKGMTERQIAGTLMAYLIKFGTEGEPLPVTVLSGENTAKILRPTDPGEREITDGDLMIVEFGARYNGYCAKMARTCAVGSIDAKRENAYNAVSCAIQDGLKAFRAGVGSKVADSVARATLNAWNMDKYCTTIFAHGIGLETVEPPFIGLEDSVSLKENTTLYTKCTVVVGANYGVKIGDMAVLTDIGCKNLTVATKNLIHI